MYKLATGGVIHPNGFFIPDNELNGDWRDYLAWLAENNVPLPADVPTPEQITKEQEIIQAPLTAKQYFAAKPAAISFIRLTPEEQEAQIEAMTLAQLKIVIKYLTIAVSALIKREFI